MGILYLYLGAEVDIYVAGWGMRSADCTTNEYGPVKNLKCHDSHKERKIVHCKQTRSPSSEIDECKNFKK